MIVRYYNNQDKSDSMNGAVVVDHASLEKLLDSKKNTQPFIAELRAENDFELVFGIGGALGFVEHRRINGDLPYLMAISRHRPINAGRVAFLTAATPTPIAARYILSFDELKVIAIHFLETGERSNSVSWEPV
jgi:Immunity protein Imm1